MGIIDHTLIHMTAHRRLAQSARASWDEGCTATATLAATWAGVVAHQNCLNVANPFADLAPLAHAWGVGNRDGLNAIVPLRAAQDQAPNAITFNGHAFTGNGAAHSHPND